MAIGRCLPRPLMILVAALFAVTACAPQAAAPEAQGGPAAKAEKPAELKIALVDFMSGPAAKFGTAALNAGTLLLDEFNQEGGIGGVKTSYVVVDENGGTEKQVTEYRRLVLDEKVDLVIGYTSSANCLGIAPVAEELQKLTVFTICGTNRVFEDATYKYVFRTSSHQASDNVAAAMYVLQVKPDVKTIAGINQDYAWGRDSWEVFKKSMQKLKPDVQFVDELWPKLGAGEYSAELSKLQAAKPDVIHTSLWGGDMDSFIKQAAPRGLFKDSMVVLTTGETALLTIGTDMPAGAVISGRGQFLLFPEPEKYPLNQKFIDSYLAKYNEIPIYPSYRMAQAVYGVKAAYEKAMALNGGAWPSVDQVIQAFENSSWDTPAGPVVMRPDHQAVQPSFYGVTTDRAHPKYGFPVPERIVTFPAVQVNPPPGVKTLDWIEAWPGAGGR